MAAKDILRRVRLIFDKKSGQQVESEAKRSLSGVEKGMATLKKAALALGATLAAAFAVRKVINFGKEVVRVAKESEEIWNRLGYAVEHVGVSFADARPEIEAFARAMQDATTVGDEDFAAILTELITTSGDYAASLNAVGLVADLAAAKQMDLTQAAQVVGRAMVGETGTFKRFGIIIQENETGMEALRRSFSGFAENEAKTLGGRLKQLANEWGDFKQALGEALITAGGGTTMLETLAGSLKVLSQWVTENRDIFKGFGDVLNALGNPLLRLLEAYAGLTKGILLAAEAQERFLAGMRTLDGLFFGIRVGPRAEGVEERLKALRAYSEGLDELIAKMKDEDRRRAAGIFLPPDRSTLSGIGTPAPSGQPEGEGDLRPLVDSRGLTFERPDITGAQMEAMRAVLPLLESQARSVELQRQGWENLNSEQEISARNAEKLAQSVEKVGEAAMLSQIEMIALNSAADLGGTLMAAVFGSDLGKLAAMKAEQNAIMAAEQLAMAAAVAWIPGFQGEAAGHLQAAAMFGSVAAAWSALAGVTGGFSGGGGGGGGRGGPRDVGGAASERTEPPGPEVHIYMEGDFDALNPRVQRVVAGAVKLSGETYGPNARVTLHRRGRR